MDAEPSDVLLEIPQGSQSAESSPVLELSLGSLQESINKQLSEMVESGEVSEGYFYIWGHVPEESRHVATVRETFIWKD